LAICRAATVRAVVLTVAVVALFELFLHDSIATTRPQRAIGGALVVATEVLGTVVALFADGDVAVSAVGRTVAASGREPRERELETRTFGFALRVEHLDRINRAVFEPEVGPGRGVDRHGTELRRMDAAQVDREPAVDEDPHVVVADELER